MILEDGEAAAPHFKAQAPVVGLHGEVGLLLHASGQARGFHGRHAAGGGEQGGVFAGQGFSEFIQRRVGEIGGEGQAHFLEGFEAGELAQAGQEFPARLLGENAGKQAIEAGAGGAVLGGFEHVEGGFGGRREELEHFHFHVLNLLSDVGCAARILQNQSTQIVH